MDRGLAVLDPSHRFLALDLGFYLTDPDERSGIRELIWISDLPPRNEPERRPATVTESALWTKVIEQHETWLLNL